jgi:hypothetical protein
MKADPGNKRRILDAFPEMVATYGTASRLHQTCAQWCSGMTTNEQYHADPAVSASHLHAIARIALPLLEPLP